MIYSKNVVVIDWASTEVYSARRHCHRPLVRRRLFLVWRDVPLCALLSFQLHRHPQTKID